VWNTYAGQSMYTEMINTLFYYNETWVVYSNDIDAQLISIW